MSMAVMMTPAAVMPHIGVLVWTWYALMQPHREAFGFSQGLPLNFLVAAFTIGAWAVSREPKRMPMTALTFALIVFTFWMVLSCASGFSWARSYPLLDRNLKTMLLAFVVMCVMVDRTRLHALVWVMTASLAFYAVKGAGFVLLTGGGSRVHGPESTHIADNNHLAAALCMTLPLLHYLRLYSTNKLIRLGLAGALCATILAVLGSYSRGGFIALVAMLAVFWWRSKRKLISFVFLIVVGAGSIAFMPQSFYDRIESITEAGEDSSFQGRINAWWMAVNLANDRPLTGGGMVGYMDPEVFQRYNPGATTRAIHSVYFQVLAEMGYVGLFLYVLIMAIAIRYAFYVVATAKRHPELQWAGDLASMFIASFAGYYVAGAALSMAYYDFYYCMLAVLIRLKLLADEARAKAQVAVPLAPPNVVAPAAARESAA